MTRQTEKLSGQQQIGASSQQKSPAKNVVRIFCPLTCAALLHILLRSSRQAFFVRSLFAETYLSAHFSEFVYLRHLHESQDKTANENSMCLACNITHILDSLSLSALHICINYILGPPIDRKCCALSFNAQHW